MFAAGETPYDLRFRMLGIPVRVHPVFWLVAMMLGWRGENLPAVAAWVACVFVSILIHEFGHGLAARAFGCRPSILLQGFGGLCSYQDGDRQTPRERLIVVASGPGAGFVFCGVVMAVYSFLYGLTISDHIGFVRVLVGMESNITDVFMKLGGPNPPHSINPRFVFYWYLVWINFGWGVINLLPIWPLDGGQITETILSQLNPLNGRRWTHIVALLVSGLCAILIYSATQQIFYALFFGYFAIINYQMLDMIHRAQTLGIYDDDWWRK